MKTMPIRPMFGLLAFASLGRLIFAADTAAMPQSKPAGTHVLFMGADLAVSREKKYYRVQDVVGSEFKIEIGRKEFFVPTRSRSTDLKVTRSLKLAAASARIEDLHSGPAYTTANDPVRKAIAASGSAGGAAATLDLAQGQVLEMMFAESNAERVAAANPGIREAQEAAEEYRGHLAEAQRKADTLGQMASYDSQNHVGAQVDRMRGELAEGNYDAMEVAFKVSSPVELDDPHLVVLFKFQAPDAKAGEEGLLIHAKALDPIGTKPKYIRIREAGLPRGFKFVDCTVHLYNRGDEVATNISPKRVELTREEARQYVLMDHVGSNKGATVPAAVVRGTLSRQSRQAFSADQLNRICYAKVAPDGSLRGVYLDESCHQELTDDATRAAFSEVFFKPALDKGKPVEGVARVSLAGI